MKKNIKGLWLFGLSGSGKTYISKKISKKIYNSFLIDGDEVRKYVSFDLRYKLKDRFIQNKRVLGIAKIVIKNNLFPIISSVYLSPKVINDIKKNNIKVIEVISKNKKRINSKLTKKRNVVGISIRQPKIKCDIIENKPNFKLNELFI